VWQMDPRPGQFSSVSSDRFTFRGTIDSHQRSGWRAGRRLVPMLFGRLVAMLVAGTLVALVPLAHASPPDPTWISGLYDGADHDDAVLAVTEGVAFPANDGPADVTADSSSTPIAFADPSWPGERSRISPVDRAPPHH
jgi:hypothetical protein